MYHDLSYLSLPRSVQLPEHDSPNQASSIHPTYLRSHHHLASSHITKHSKLSCAFIYSFIHTLESKAVRGYSSFLEYQKLIQRHQSLRGIQRTNIASWVNGETECVDKIASQKAGERGREIERDLVIKNRPGKQIANNNQRKEVNVEKRKRVIVSIQFKTVI